MTTIDQIQNNTQQVYFQNAQKNLGDSRLDREGFMRLIMAQLQYQDPTNPQDNTQMLNQQLQLEQADQTQAMVQATQFSQASNMIGKTATLMDAPWDFDTGTPTTPDYDATTGGPKMLTGVIESVQFDKTSGKALIKINGQYYDSTSVQGLYNSNAIDAGTVAGASSLMGKNVQMVDAPWDPVTKTFVTPTKDSTTGLSQIINGKIQNIQFDPTTHKTLVQINGKYYDADTIQQILPDSTAST